MKENEVVWTVIVTLNKTPEGDRKKVALASDDV